MTNQGSLLGNSRPSITGNLTGSQFNSRPSVTGNLSGSQLQNRPSISSNSARKSVQ